jgi:inorganic triphosphatase YgiF
MKLSHEHCALRFVIDEELVQQIWTRVKDRQLVTGKRKTSSSRVRYLDTPDHALEQADISLWLQRVRRHWMQTIEIGTTPQGGLSIGDRFQNTAPQGHPCIDAIFKRSIRDEINRQVNRSPLVPVCEAVVRRSSIELSPDSGSRAQLTIESSDILAAGRSAMLCEAEIALLTGKPGLLFDLTHLLLPAGGLHFSRLSKVARGHLLAERGCIDPPLEPYNAKEIVLHGDGSVEKAAHEILRECLDHIFTNVTVVDKLDDSEGPHQLRVGLRRLRSAFSIFSSALKNSEMARLSEEARWFGQEVGRLRDLDVIVTDIVQREADRHPEELGLQELGEALGREEKALRERLRQIIKERRCQAFLIDLARFVHIREWLDRLDLDQTERLAMPVSEHAAAALNKRWKKTVKRARGFDSLNDEQRHELRKELKKLRYAVEFFFSLFPAKRVEPFLKRLKKLQNVFGELNDAAMVKATLRNGSIGGPLSAGRATGWILGASQARAELGWIGAKSLWRRLEETKPFWR